MVTPNGGDLVSARRARGGNRTRKPFRAMDFESIAFADFATRAGNQVTGAPQQLRVIARQSPELMPRRLAMTLFMIWSVPAPMR